MCVISRLIWAAAYSYAWPVSHGKGECNVIQCNTLSTPSTRKSLPTDEKELVSTVPRTVNRKCSMRLSSNTRERSITWCISMCQSSETAKDLSQEIFIKAYRAPASISNDSPHSIVGSIGLPPICVSTSFANRSEGRLCR